ncbi:unnamed protein product [Arctogadus glacialis]
MATPNNALRMLPLITIIMFFFLPDDTVKKTQQKKNTMCHRPLMMTSDLCRSRHTFTRHGLKMNSRHGSLVGVVDVLVLVIDQKLLFDVFYFILYIYIYILFLFAGLPSFQICEFRHFVRFSYVLSTEPEPRTRTFHRTGTTARTSAFCRR